MSTSPVTSTASGRPDPPRLLVVGVDQGGRSTGAVVWAAEEAERTGCVLHLVTAAPEGSRSQVEAEQIRSGLAGLARRLVLTDMSCDVRVGPTHEVLLDASAGASMIVVGRRSFGSLHRLIVGSVSLALAAEAEVPVVIVPEQWLQPSMSSAPMVLGLDPEYFSGATDPGMADPEHEALAFAFGRAARARIPLIVVSSSPVLPQHRHGAAYAARQRRTEAQRLEERLAAWRAAWPEVELVARSSDLPPGRALVEAASTAQLTVLGRGPSGPVPRRRPGPTARHALHHLSRPIAVVPLGRPGDGPTHPTPSDEKEQS